MPSGDTPLKVNAEMHRFIPATSLQEIPPDDWAVRVLPPEREEQVMSFRQLPPSEFVDDIIQSYHYGPSLVTVTKNTQPFSSLLDRFTPDEYPPAPATTLLPKKPGSPLEEPPESAVISQVLEAQQHFSSVAGAHAALRVDSQRDDEDKRYTAWTTSGRHIPLFASLSTTGLFQLPLGSVEETIGARRPITSKNLHGTSERAALAWAEMPLGVHFVVRMDRLAVAGCAADGAVEPAALLDANGLPNERVWATAALYSLSEKRRISEIFGWNAGPGWTERTAEAAAQATSSRRCRTALFCVPYAAEDIYLVVRLWRCLQGARRQADAAGVYSALASARELARNILPAGVAQGGHLPPRLRRRLDQFVAANAATQTRFGGSPPLESFAIAACRVFEQDASGRFQFRLALPQPQPEPVFAPPFANEAALAEAAASTAALSDGDGAAALADGVEPSRKWRLFRINAASETQMDIGPFFSYTPTQFPSTLGFFLTSRSVDSGTIQETKCVLETSSIKPKRVHLGGDADVLRHLMDVERGHPSGDKLHHVVLRARARLLTQVRPPAVPSVQHPVVFPRGLIRSDLAAEHAASWLPPLSWLLGPPAPGVDMDQEATLLLHPIASRSPLFTRRDLEAIGQAGYSGEQTPATELTDFIGRKITYTTTMTPEEEALAYTEFVDIPQAQRVVTLNSGSSMVATVLDGAVPMLLSADDRTRGSKASAPPALICPHPEHLKYWLVPRAPGTASLRPEADALSISAVTQRAGAPTAVSAGEQLGSVEDVLLVSPLSAFFKDIGVKAKNVMVRVEFLNEDSRGMGNWEEVYRACPSAVSASAAISHHGNGDILAPRDPNNADQPSAPRAMLSGPPVRDPLAGHPGAVACILPGDPVPRPLHEDGPLRSQQPLRRAGVTAVSYHSPVSHWSDEFRIRIPTVQRHMMSPKAHLLFTFFNVTVQSNGSHEPYQPIGFSFYPLVDRKHPMRVMAARNVGLPVAAFLPPGYLSVSGYHNRKDVTRGVIVPNLTAPHIPWYNTEQERDKEGVETVLCRPLFFVNVELVSSLRTNSRQIAAIYDATRRIFELNPVQFVSQKADEVTRLAASLESLPMYVSSAAEFMRHFPHLLTALLQALVYANACSYFSAMHSELPQHRRRTTLAPDGQHHTRYLCRQLFHVIVNTLRLAQDIRRLENPNETGDRTSDLDFYAAAVFDGLYRGPWIDKDSSQLPAEIQLRLPSPFVSPRDVVHPIADALCRVWTVEAGGSTVDEKYTQIVTHEETDATGASIAPEIAWFFFDLIVKDLQLALTRADPEHRFDCRAGRGFKPAIYADISALVTALTRWVVRDPENSRLEPLNRALALFLRDILDVLDRQRAVQIIADSWQSLFAEATRRRQGCRELWRFWFDGWKVLFDHPRFGALAGVGLYQSVVASLTQWHEQTLRRSHFLMYLLLSTVQQGLLTEDPPAQTTAMLIWLLGRLDADASLESTDGLDETPRQSFASLLWGLADFIFLNGHHLLQHSGSFVPLTPLLQLEDPDVNVSTQALKLCLCVVWIMRHLPRELVASWLRTESAEHRELIYNGLSTTLQTTDLRALLLAVRRLAASGSPRVSLAVREDIVTHVVGTVTTTVTRILGQLADTLRLRVASVAQNEVILPPGSIPGAGIEPAMLLTLAARQLCAPVIATDEVFGRAIELLTVLTARFPAAVVCTPVWSLVVLSVLQLADSGSPLVRALVAAAFVEMMRVNHQLCKGRAEAVLYSIGWTPSTETITDAATATVVEMLLQLRTERTIAQTRVAALVAVSNLMSRAERLGQGTELRELLRPFAQDEGRERLRDTLERVVATADSEAPDIAAAASELTRSLLGIVADSSNIEQMRRHLSSVDLSDVVDLYVRQTCLYLSVPVISLRWLESLLALLLTCATTVTGALPGGRVTEMNELQMPDAENPAATRYVEAGITAICAATVLASRLSVPFDRLLDSAATPVQVGANGDSLVLLSRTLIPRLALICPALESIADTTAEHNELADHLWQAIALTGAGTGGSVRLNSADLTVADTYSGTPAESMERLLRLLHIAATCFMLEGPFSEMALIANSELSALMRRLAARNGLLFQARMRGSQLLVPHPFLREAQARKYTVPEYERARPAPQQVQELAMNSAAGWWRAIEANNTRTSLVARGASTRTENRPMSNYYLVCVYARRFFELARERAQQPGAALPTAALVDVTGMPFIYRQPGSMTLGEFSPLLIRVWQQRVRDVLGAAAAHPGCVRQCTTATVKEADKQLSEEQPVIVLQLLTVQPLEISPFFGAKGSDDWHCAERLLTEARLAQGRAAPSSYEVDEVYREIQRSDAHDSRVGLADSPKTAGFKSGLHVSRFFFESMVNLVTGRNGDPSAGPYLTAGRRTILHTPLAFPSLLPRMRVLTTEEATTMIKPVRATINTLKKQTDEIEISAMQVARGDSVPRALDGRVYVEFTGAVNLNDPSAIERFVTFGVQRGKKTQPRNISQLQLKLQGSVMCLINSGPVAAARPFLEEREEPKPATPPPASRMQSQIQSPAISEEDEAESMASAGDADPAPAHPQGLPPAPSAPTSAPQLTSASPAQKPAQPPADESPESKLPPEMAPTPTDTMELRMVMARFYRMVRFGLDVEAAFCPMDVQPFHRSLELAFLDMRSQLIALRVPLSD